MTGPYSYGVPLPTIYGVSGRVHRRAGPCRKERGLRTDNGQTRKTAIKQSIIGYVRLSLTLNGSQNVAPAHCSEAKTRDHYRFYDSFTVKRSETSKAMRFGLGRKSLQETAWTYG